MKVKKKSGEKSRKKFPRLPKVKFPEVLLFGGRRLKETWTRILKSPGQNSLDGEKSRIKFPRLPKVKFPEVLHFWQKKTEGDMDENFE